MSERKIKSFIIIIAVIVIIAIVAFLFFSRRQKHHQSLPKAVKINTANQPMIGNPHAKIHFVAFEDLKCANCMRYNTTLYPTVKKDYIDTGIANYTFINLAFIDGSIPAANAARCIYHQNKKLFFPFVKYVYFHQPPETENWATIPKLLSMASKVPGVKIKPLSVCLITSPYTKFIRNNLKLATKVMGPSVATPSIYINGVLVRPLTLARIKTVVKAVTP